MFAKQKGKWRPNVQVQVLSPGLELNDVGFLPRTDADLDARARCTT